MAAISLNFSKVGDVWQATTDSLGCMVLQVRRTEIGDISIERYIDGMKPLPCTRVLKKDVNIIIPFRAPKGMKLRITSTSQVVKAMLLETVFSSGSAGSISYNRLEDKPQIGGVELEGNKTLNDLGIQPAGDYATKADIGNINGKLDVINGEVI